MVNNNKDIIGQYFRDKYGNIIKTHIVETIEIPDSAILSLQGIPDEFDRVSISSPTGMIEINLEEPILNKNEYKVDYNANIVFFHPNMKLTKVLVDYYTLGCLKISADRVFYKTNNIGEIEKTLGDLFACGEKAVLALEEFGDFYTAVVMLKDVVCTAIDTNSTLNDNINIAKPLIGKLDTLIPEATNIEQRLNPVVAEGRVLDITLRQNVADGRVVNTNLETSISHGQPIVDKINESGVRSFQIESSQWKLNSTTGLYECELTHNLGTTKYITEIRELVNDKWVTATISISSNGVDKCDLVSDNNNPNQIIMIKVAYNGDSSVIDIDSVADGENKVILTRTERDNIYNYSYMPQSPMPQKQGELSNTHKIVYKRDENDLLVIQKTNSGYMRYQFNNNVGVTADGSNHGGEHQLIRLVDARPLESSYLWKGIFPTSGVVSEYESAKLEANTIEQSLMNLSDRNDARNISSRPSNIGFPIYRQVNNTETEYSFTSTYCNKSNLVISATPTSVDKTEIYVNNVLVKEFNPRMYLKNGTYNGVGIIEFDVPTLTATSTYTVKIKTYGTSGYLYYCCFNFKELKDYNGEDVQYFKCIGSNKNGFITTGANDYALCDNDGKWFGSYHGGETLEGFEMDWNSTIYTKLNTTKSIVNVSDVSNGSWRLLKDFNIYQRTDLLNKAKMNSLFDFNQDGTINMKFSFINNGDLLLNAFCTALTCTDKSFDHILMPQYLNLGTTPTETQIKIPMTEGFLRQYNSTDKTQLDIRYSKFNNKNNKRDSYILDSKYYRKFYYNVISDVQNVKLETIQFSKALDFKV